MTDTLAPHDPRFVFAAAVRTAGALLDSLDTDDLGRPTPCDAYDVRSLAGHLVSVLRRVAALGAGADPLAMPVVTTGIADDGWGAAWLAVAHEVQLAWSDPAVLEREMVLPWATAPGAGMLALYTAELTVHTWDLATALGRPAAFDEQAVTVALGAAAHALPDGDREAAFAEVVARMPEGVGPVERPFANPVAVDASASPIDRLIAWYGRRP